MGRKRVTKETRYVKLAESRIREIEQLVASWPYETKSFMRARLNQFRPRGGVVNAALEWLVSLVYPPQRRHFVLLKDPHILTDWQRRFEVSGETNPQQAWNKLLEKEVSPADYQYLTHLLDRELADVHVPDDVRNLFEKVYQAHIRKEFVSDPEVPKAPLLLVIGSSGSGKTATVSRAVEEVIFLNRVLPEVDLHQKREEVLGGEPFWKTIEAVDPTLAMEINRRRRIKRYHFLSRVPLLRRVLQKRISRHLSELEERGAPVDYALVTPNDYQTALAGEPGNYFRKAMGDPRKTAIRHVEEAHSAFGKAESRLSGVESQQKTLVDTSNIVLDEIINGRRDCLLIATSDQPERFDSAVYRRFVEKGRIIEIAEFWKDKHNVRELVRLELLRADMRVGVAPEGASGQPVTYLPPEQLDQAVDQLFTIFRERALKLTPSYVRKMVHSVIQIKGGFRPEYLQDALLVRSAFEHVARNAYGDMYKRVVDRMDRSVAWEQYIGGVKNQFSELANNSLYYGVSDEKGIVLNGPPGGGKTFLARTWLSENPDVHDIAVRPSDLQDPTSPVDGTVANLETVYDIAKMIGPALVFFDEGDALAPRRSQAGGSPQDKLTNKFLNIIDGEVPLNRVFTVLTTNRLDILDPALIRSKRLKVIEISGHLNVEDIQAIIAKKLEGTAMGPGVDVARIVEVAKNICNTPADFAAFVEKAGALRSTECEVIQRFRALGGESDEAKETFVKFNMKTLAGILEAIDAPQAVRTQVRTEPLKFLSHYQEILALLADYCGEAEYPLMQSHLQGARKEMGESPVKKGKVQLDEFLEAELSQEPQVGFVIGVGANDVAGVLLPIASSLTYNISPEKVMVTGAVSSNAPNAAEMDMAVQMTQQSAREAFTLVENYLASLAPKVNVPRVLGEFLDKYTIHHQLLSASYNVGGPSAGYALALNTLSALLHMPVYNDFGITGAPWTKGVRSGEVGSSVIIGGHQKKTEKVLQYLRRMYMPLQNYRDMAPEFLAGCWEQGKDVLGVTHFGDLVPEVIWLGQAHEEKLLRLVSDRIGFKLEKFHGRRPGADIKKRILEGKAELRATLEEELNRRLDAIRGYLQSADPDPHLSLEEIFRDGRRKRIWSIRRLTGWRGRDATDEPAEV